MVNLLLGAVVLLSLTLIATLQIARRGAKEMRELTEQRKAWDGEDRRRTEARRQ